MVCVCSPVDVERQKTRITSESEPTTAAEARVGPREGMRAPVLCSSGQSLTNNSICHGLGVCRVLLGSWGRHLLLMLSAANTHRADAQAWADDGWQLVTAVTTSKAAGLGVVAWMWSARAVTFWVTVRSLKPLQLSQLLARVGVPPFRTH